MKKIIFLLLILIATSCSISKEYIILSSHDYPYIGTLIEGYYNGNYEYPKTANDFISYYDLKEMKEMNRSYPKTIRNIKNNKNDIVWILDSSRLIVYKKNDTIYYETTMRNPCEELDYNIGLYITNKFFNNEGRNVYSKELDSNFRKGLKETIVNTGTLIDECGDVILLKYTPETGLVSFCEDAEKSVKFYDALNSYLENFVRENKLSKVLFLFRKFQ